MLFHSLFWLFAKGSYSEAIDRITSAGSFQTSYFVLFLLCCFALPWFLGMFCAKRLRMKDYGWKLALIFISLMLGGEIVGRIAIDDWGRDLGIEPWSVSNERFDLKLGVDLQGGVILIYERDANAPDPSEEEEGNAVAGSADGSVKMNALIEALKRRINPSGTKEIVVRAYGADQVEIIIPEVDQRAVEQIKRTISTAGVLEFRIVANPHDHDTIIALAREMADDPSRKYARVVRDAKGEGVGLWARVARDEGEAGTVRPFKLSVATDTVRNSSTGELLEIPLEHRGDDRFALTDYVESLGIVEIDVLMATDDGYDVNGGHLGSVGRGYDSVMNPCITFNMRGEGVPRFSSLTREYSPDGQRTRQLGILLDNELLSAPAIQEMISGSGQITGNFTDEEISFMVNILEAGSLPVVLNKIPISENLINPLLGAETIRQGKTAIAISLGIVLLFILFYYRFAGIVACMALLANLLFIVALMVLIKGAFTLPGLAGLVLTVGMSIDANVLIFERIREELSRGAAMRMAIRNGFARATTTIVDANVTTLITAIVLYAIGTDQIRGFAVTLILGILMSMFTAIFCSRVIFDIAERVRWISQLNMTQLLSATQIDFVGKRWVAGAFSTVVILIGLAGIVGRGTDIFDIDLWGGTSVHLMLDDEVETDRVREPLARAFSEQEQDFTLTAMNAAGGLTTNNIFKVDSSISEVEDLQEAIEKALENTDLSLATYSLDYGSFERVKFSNQKAAAQTETAADSTDPPASTDGTSEPETNQPETSSSSPDQGASNRRSDLPDDSLLALATPQAPDSQTESGQTDAPESATGESDNGQADAAAEGDSDSEAETDEQDVVAEVSTDDQLSGLGTVEEKQPAEGQIKVELNFGHKINADTLNGEINDASEDLEIPVSYHRVENPNWDGESSNAFTDWTLYISASEAEVTRLLDHLRSQFSATPVWPSSSKIGGQVAGRMQNTAIAALLTSLMGIVIYIWIRFQRVIFGLAAVVALVHDVLVTLGAIAVSAWLAQAFGFLLIDSFKISLPIVAALLTIIGYSLNDTIVVFDRIREVRGKSPELTADMINRSINQTLSRTVLTSLTTLIVVLILYAVGGQGIHGFAFALVVGVVVGTYSSIFVASPTLLWMTGVGKAGDRKSAAA